MVSVVSHLFSFSPAIHPEAPKRTPMLKAEFICPSRLCAHRRSSRYVLSPHHRSIGHSGYLVLRSGGLSWYVVVSMRTALVAFLLHLSHRRRSMVSRLSVCGFEVRRPSIGLPQSRHFSQIVCVQDSSWWGDNPHKPFGDHSISNPLSCPMRIRVLRVEGSFRYVLFFNAVS